LGWDVQETELPASGRVGAIAELGLEIPRGLEAVAAFAESFHVALPKPYESFEIGGRFLRTVLG
jgi:hypothetical protein